jgi:DNA polymerase-3 subunit gamma/tau
VSQIALYRKYRSADLDDIVGQEHITKTLSAAIKADKLSHAYLFTGPRGVGKTSVARILARTVNGIEPEDEVQNFLDIVEIDAASNRGIDEIRSLREKVAVAPAKLKYKVYIIDEAHMLTREAFNALLKTLEEPPAHVIFILATTEANKLPETIISRTQRYDFHAFNQEEIVGRLKHIAKTEKINITDSAIEQIAQVSGGGMRDAIGLLDQLAALETQIDEQTTSQFLGLANNADVLQILQTCKSGKSAKAIEDFKQILDSGVSAIELLFQLQNVARAELLKVIEKSNDQTEFYIKALDILHIAATQMAFSAQASIPVQLALVKLSIIDVKAHSEIAKPSSDNLEHIDKNLKKPNSSEDNSNKLAANLSQAKPIVDTTNTKGINNQQSADIISLTDKALSNIKEHNNSLYALLRSGEAHVDKNKLLVSCRFAFHKNRIEEHHNRLLIEKNMSKVFGMPIELVCKLDSSPAPKTEDTNPESELVSSAMAILGGELIDG